MTREFTDEDRGKPVHNPYGTHIGKISDVRDGRGQVEIEDASSLTEKLKSALGWDDSDDTYELRSEDVDSVTDDEVRLRER